MNSPSKLQMNPDTFLFTVLEAYEARKQPGGRFKSHTRYEPFLFENYVPPAQRDLEAFATELHEVVKHHWAVAPQYRRSEPVNLDTISFFSQSVSTLVADINSLFKIFVGVDLPTRPVGAIELEGDSLPALSGIIDRYTEYVRNPPEEPAPFSPWTADGDLDAERSELSRESWWLIEGIISEVLQDYSSIVLAFTQWKFGPTPAREEIDWRVRPPVGDAFEKWLKGKDLYYSRQVRDERLGIVREERPPRDRDRKGGERGPRPEHPRTEHHTESGADGEPKPLRAVHRPKIEPTPVVEETAPKPKSDHSMLRPRGEQQSVREGGRPFAHDRNGSRDQKSTDEQLQEALNAAKEAIAKLKKDRTLSEYPLDPVNSFLRRQQHTVIIDAGFDTESRGEGRDRCVFVKRK